MGALNARLSEPTADLNGRTMRRYNASRRELFERLDGPALAPLPEQPFEVATWKKVGLNIDYHVEFDHHLYSASHTLLHEELWVRATASTVEILHGGTRVAPAQPRAWRAHDDDRPHAEHASRSRRVDAVARRPILALRGSCGVHCHWNGPLTGRGKGGGTGGRRGAGAPRRARGARPCRVRAPSSAHPLVLGPGEARDPARARRHGHERLRGAGRVATPAPGTSRAMERSPSHDHRRSHPDPPRIELTIPADRACDRPITLLDPGPCAAW